MPAPRKWTEADNAYLRKVWTDPAVHRDDIAKRLGKTVDTIRMQAKRLALGGRPRKKASHEWPDDHREHAKTQWLAGVSAESIAKSLCKEFGADAVYSRAAVLALCITRLGLARHSPASHLTSKPKPNPKPKMVFTPTAVFVDDNPNQPRFTDRADAWKPIAGSFPRPWEERPSTGCKWPLTVDGVEGMSCCEPVERRGYCGVHAQAAFAPTGTAKDLMRGLRRVL